MQNKTKLALFDIDGTIAVNGVVPESVLEGIKHLHQKGYITTVSTGRGYIRLKDMLGDIFDSIISPEALIIIEHGTKIVDRQGNVIFGEFLNEQELEHVIDFTRENIQLFKLAWFNPENVSEKVKIWCIDEKDVQEETEKRGKYADVFNCSIGEFKDMLAKYRLTNVSLRLKEYVKVENLKLAFTRTDTNVIFQDSNMEFVKRNTNKGIAVEYVAKRLNITNENLLIAGNAINDVEMLDVGAGMAILVSTGDDRQTILSYLSEPDKIIKINTAQDLGEFLQNI